MALDRGSHGPLAANGGSLSPALAVASDTSDHCQSASSTTNQEPEAQTSVPTLVSQVQESATSAGSTIKSNKPVEHEKMGAEMAEYMPGTIDHEQLEALEAEVLHFMNVSMEEMSRSTGLCEKLAATTQEKHDVEQRLRQLQEKLDSANAGTQATDTSILGLQNMIANLNTTIDDLRRKTQQQEVELTDLRANVEQCTKTKGELADRLEMARTENAQETQISTDLKRELEESRQHFESQRTANATLQKTLRQAREQREEMRKLKTSTDRRLTSAVETESTLSTIVKRKTAELEDVKAAAKNQVEEAQQEASARRGEIKALADAKALLTNKNKELESALSESGMKLITAETANLKIGHLRQENEILQRSLDLERESHQQEKADAMNALSQELERLKKRQDRTVAICVDFSGSVANSGLTEGLKRFYAHLLDHLKRAACKTHVMSVVHGVCGTARVKSKFWDSWNSHETALEGEQADGCETYVACLRKIQDATINNGSFVADLQVVLIGDGAAFGGSAFDQESLCLKFSSSKPPVPLHSVVVQKGAGTGKPAPGQGSGIWAFGQKDWYTWDYSARTQGKELYWGQDSPLPELSNFIL